MTSRQARKLLGKYYPAPLLGHGSTNTKTRLVRLFTTHKSL